MTKKRQSGRRLTLRWALLGFAVVCITGLVQGNSFPSVIKSALLALAAGGAAGMLLAYVIRVVAAEGFNRQFRQAQLQSQEQSAAAPPDQKAPVPAEQQSSARPAAGASASPIRN